MNVHHSKRSRPTGSSAAVHSLTTLPILPPVFATIAVDVASLAPLFARTMALAVTSHRHMFLKAYARRRTTADVLNPRCFSPFTCTLVGNLYDLGSRSSVGDALVGG